MEYETLDSTILAALPRQCEVLSIVQHGSTNWSTGLRVDIQDGDEEKCYFLKIIEREELVGMAEAEYEGQKAIASVIPDNAVKPVAWGYFAETSSKAWYMAEFLNLRARAPPLEQFLPIVEQMHQKSVSPTGKFGFHVTPFYGPPPMEVGWTDSWEEFWVREFRSGLKYVEKMRGEDPELLIIAEEFIQKVAARLLRPLQTGGRNVKPSLCHGDLWDGNIQFNVDTQQPVVFDPCPFYGHHEMDFQCMRSPRYIIGQDFITLYKVKIGASEPSEDFDDRIALYSIRNDLMTAGMWPQWASLVDKAKEEMRRLIEKYPKGLDGFMGSLEPTIVTAAQKPRVQRNVSTGNHDTRNSEPIDSAIELSSPQKMAAEYVRSSKQQQPCATQFASDPTNTNSGTVDHQSHMVHATPPYTAPTSQFVGQTPEKDDECAARTPPDTPINSTHFKGENKEASGIDSVLHPMIVSSASVDRTGLIGVGGGLRDTLTDSLSHDGTDAILPEYSASLADLKSTPTRAFPTQLYSPFGPRLTAVEASTEVAASEVAVENSGEDEWRDDELSSDEVVTKKRVRLPFLYSRRKVSTLHSSRDKSLSRTVRQKAAQKTSAQQRG